MDTPKIFLTDYASYNNEYFARAQQCGYDAEVIEAFAACGNYSPNDVDEFFEALEESYAGEYESDEDFAQEMAEQCGFDQPSAWPYYCIDWESAARDLMHDYYSHNGHYFRLI